MATPSSHLWFVQAGSEAWGPYTEARIAAFVAEGRTGPATPVSPFAAGPWTAAGDMPEFAALFRGARENGPRPSDPAPRVAAVTPAAAPATATLATVSPARSHGAGPARPLLVFAELSSLSATAFHAALLAFGPCAAIRPGLWLVRARSTAAELRNPLSRKLGATDTLVVVEATLDHAAWFNLDPAADRELRRLWVGRD